MICKHRIWVLIIAWALICPSLLYAASFQGKVVGVSDGDTLKVLKDAKQVKIRLAAIDCPEKGQPYGQKAFRTVNNQLTILNCKFCFRFQ
jgi:endonuclease YncB( thermonuclease family)